MTSVSSEETEVGIGAPFRGVQLDKQRLLSSEGKKPQNTHAMRLALFPMHQEEHIHTQVLHQQNVIRRARYSPTISIKMLQQPRIRLIDAMKMMGCSARGWGWLVEKLNNCISRV